MGLGKLPRELIDPLLLKIRSVHVPAKWTQKARAREIMDTLAFVGAEPRIPLYLLPVLQEKFPPLPARTKVTVKSGAKLEAGEAGDWRLTPDGHEKEATFEVSGQTPASARAGDIVLVKVTATYPKTARTAARSVEFLQVIHITDKAK